MKKTLSSLTSKKFELKKVHGGAGSGETTDTYVYTIGCDTTGGSLDSLEPTSCAADSPCGIYAPKSSSETLEGVYMASK